jgi:hypothetical protein
MKDPEQCSMQLFGNVFVSRVIEYFFRERLAFIDENKYPIILPADPPCRFIMHIIPEIFQELYLDINNLTTPGNFLIPLGESEESILCDYNFDGLLFLSSRHQKFAYTQVFRDGKVETVAAIASGIQGSRENFLHLISLQRNLLQCLHNHLTILSKNGVPGPYYLFFRLLGVENMRLSPGDIAEAGYDGKGLNKPLIRNELRFPRYKLEHHEVNLEVCLFSFFEILWNTFGFQRNSK